MKHRILLICIMIFLTSNVYSAEDGDHHPNHIAIAGGMSWHDSKNSGYIGADYVRIFPNNWGVGVIYEEVSGDFDLQVFALVVKHYFKNGFNIGGGVGVERKIKKNKNLALARLDAGYAWHIGNWSVGPVAVVDFIEDGNTTYYAGVSVGYGW